MKKLSEMLRDVVLAVKINGEKTPPVNFTMPMDPETKTSLGTTSLSLSLCRST